MKSLQKKFLTVFIVIVIIFLIVTSTFVFKKDQPWKTIYNIDAKIIDEYLYGKLRLEFINNDTDVNELYFCLYPNAFKSEENILNTTASEKISEAYPNGFDKGYINIMDVFLDGEKVDFLLEDNEQILKIITGKIKHGTKKEIEIVFEEKLPNSPARFGYGKNTYNFGNWYPVLCPIENGNFVKSFYTANGDPFYSECSDYFVNITVSSEYRIASSGKIIKKEFIDHINTQWQIQGEKIRDFAFVISSDYKLKSKQVGETIVYSYYLFDDNLGEHALNCAVNALNIFNKKFGTYPYQTLTVAETDFYIGGMEYPNLVYINTELYNNAAKEALEEVVVHEVAHQWWYGVIGNNEIKEPWLDEGLTQYSVALFYEDIYGVERYKSYLSESENYCKLIFDILKKSNISVNKKIDRSSYEFEHWLLYNVLSYDVSALMFDDLRKNLGDELFFKGLKKYYNDHIYKNAEKNDFFVSMQSATGKNVEGFMKPWLEGKIYWG